MGPRRSLALLAAALLAAGCTIPVGRVDPPEDAAVADDGLHRRDVEIIASGPCEQGEWRCYHPTLWTCDATGHWVTKACPYLCSDGECTGVCEPGSRSSCQGGAPVVCNARGEWEVLPACSGDLPRCVLGACAPAAVCGPEGWCEELSPGLDTGAVMSIAGRSDADMWVIGYNACGWTCLGLVHWDGGGWSRLYDQPLAGKTVLKSQDGELWAFGSGVARWDGSTWLQSLPQENVVRGASPSGTYGWAVGDAIVWRWDGSAWSSASPWASGNLDVWGSSSTDAWILAADHLWHWDGVNWTAFDFPDAVSMTRLWGAASDDIWAAGEGLWHWDGAAWSRFPAGFGYDVLNDIWGSGPNDVWTCGSMPGVVHWDGTSWKQVPFPEDATCAGGWVAPSGDVWIVGDTSVWRLPR